MTITNHCIFVSGVARGGGDGGGPPWAVLFGCGKIEVIPKNKNREDLKKGRQKNWGDENNLGGQKNF